MHLTDSAIVDKGDADPLEYDNHIARRRRRRASAEGSAAQQRFDHARDLAAIATAAPHQTHAPVTYRDFDHSRDLAITWKRTEALKKGRKPHPLKETQDDFDHKRDLAVTWKSMPHRKGRHGRQKASPAAHDFDHKRDLAVTWKSMSHRKGRHGRKASPAAHDFDHSIDLRFASHKVTKAPDGSMFGWLIKQTSNGRVYYQNVKTKVTTFEKPEILGNMHITDNQIVDSALIPPSHLKKDHFADRIRKEQEQARLQRRRKHELKIKHDLVKSRKKRRGEQEFVKSLKNRYKRFAVFAKFKRAARKKLVQPATVAPLTATTPPSVRPSLDSDSRIMKVTAPASTRRKKIEPVWDEEQTMKVHAQHMSREQLMSKLEHLMTTAKPRDARQILDALNLARVKKYARLQRGSQALRTAKALERVKYLHGENLAMQKKLAKEVQEMQAANELPQHFTRVRTADNLWKNPDHVSDALSNAIDRLDAMRANPKRLISVSSVMVVGHQIAAGQLPGLSDQLQKSIRSIMKHLKSTQVQDLNIKN
jgi:hypothetical protein